MKNIVTISNCRSGHNFVMNQISSWLPDANVVNFEDVLPEKYISQSDHWLKCGLINPEYPVIYVIVIRDLLNWWASYLKWITKDGPQTEEKLMLAFRIWKEQAQDGFEKYGIFNNSVTIL